MAFIPPFCPHTGCDNHHLDDDDLQAVDCGDRPIPPARERWWVRRGSFSSDHSGAIPRYRCRCCRRSFSTRSFSVHFATHRLIDLERLAARINNGGGIRGIARELGCSPNVVLNRIARLARGAIGVHSDLRRLFALDEDLVADGFESFVASQYWPAHFNILVGSESQYFYSVDYAQLRRKGRMTASQRRRRDELDARVAIEPGQVRRSFSRILAEMQRLWLEPEVRPHCPHPRSLTLTTDRHKSYPLAIADEPVLGAFAAEGLFAHRQVDSRAPRTFTNPMFSANYFDREIRKDIAAHVRESVQYARRANNAMDRMWLYGVWHNCFKPRRINGGDTRTHAEYAGVPTEQLHRVRARLYSKRYFLSRMSLSPSQWRTWVRGWATPQVQRAVMVPAYVMA